MISERFPDLLKLSTDERLHLANELYDSVFHFGPAVADDHISNQLQKGWQEYLANPESAESWEVVKARLLAGRDA